MATSTNPVPKDKDAGASKTTAFSTAAKFLMIPTAVTLVLAATGFSFRIAALPYLVITLKMVKVEKGETRLEYLTKLAVLVVFYCGFLSAFAFLVLMPLVGPRWTGYHALAFYLPMFTITLHDRRHQYGPLGTFVVRYFFDVPLVIAGYVCCEFFGVRLLAPFATILDDTVVQGSMPFPSDIGVLAAEPYNVGMIVNMCREYGGATDEMKACGIVQCHLPHQDTTPPSYESLVKGCAYIRQFRKHNPKKRVYIHCKGGIGRASTMTLAHYIRNENREPSVAMRSMKAKRPVIFEGVKEFPGILRLNEERLSGGSSANEPTKAE